MTSISPDPLLQDFKITFQQSTLVFPSQHTEKKCIYLAYPNQMFAINFTEAHFFKANPDFPPEVVSKRLKLALERVLVPYDFMAGRLQLNDQLGRYEINCNASGAGFVVASSDYTLVKIGDLACPNLGSRQLAVESLDNLAKDEDQPLFILQVTSFKCGGFSIGMSVKHVLFDGVASKTFKDNLASQAFHDARPLAVAPYFNRYLLAPRSPPLVSFQHPQLFIPHRTNELFDYKRVELDYRVLKLTTSDIDFLMGKAKCGIINSNLDTRKISCFSLVCALIWRCKALSLMSWSNNNNIEDKVFSVLSVVDIRSRLNPPLPKAYSGNAVLHAYSSARITEIEKGPFGKLVEMVSEATKRVTDEYAKSMIDWLETNNGQSCGDYVVSSWIKLGYEHVVYPWGKPIHSCPLLSHKKNICWLFPGVNGTIYALVLLNYEAFLE